MASDEAVLADLERGAAELNLQAGISVHVNAFMRLVKVTCEYSYFSNPIWSAEQYAAVAGLEVERIDQFSTGFSAIFLRTKQ